MYQKPRKIFILILIAAFTFTLAIDIFLNTSVQAAPSVNQLPANILQANAGSPQPTRPPRPGCHPPPQQPGSIPYPQCLGAGLEITAGWQPNIASLNQPFTYTLSLHDGGVQPATNVELDLELLGSQQKFVSFDPGTTGWTLITAPGAITNTVRINVGSLAVGQSTSSVTIATIFPYLDAAAVNQYANVTWNDANGFTSRGRTMSIPIDYSQFTPPPLPTAPPIAAPPPSLLTNAAPPFVPIADPGAGVDGPKSWYFPTTSHSLNDQLGFLTYWLKHGSVTILGFPLSEVYTDADTGFQSQYFERGVLEYHPYNPDPYKVEIRSLGREAGQVQPAIVPGQPPSSGSIFYPQTGHWLDARFAAFWQSNGGLEQFGYPIGEPVTQADGKIVQWFERARFEYSLSETGYPLVQLGLVGRESAIKKNYLPY